MEIGNIKVINGAQYTSDGKVLLRCHSNTTGDFVIPEGVKIIKSKAFHNTQIRSVTFPNSLERIEDSAFWNCKKLEHINFGAEGSYVLMEEGIFAWCTHLKRIDIPGTIRIIGADCFRGCPLEKVILHEGLVKIESGAFYPVEGIKEIRFPASLMHVGRMNFLQAEKVYADNPYCNGVIDMCIASNCLTECHMNGKTVYLPELIRNETLIKTITGHIQFNVPERFSYMDILDDYLPMNDVYENDEYEKWRITVKIAQKTGDEEVIDYLKTFQSRIVNYLYKDREAILGAVKLDIFCKENLMNILHTDCFVDDAVMLAHVLNALKKYDDTPEYDI